jgi:hypothetical protein
MRAVFNTVVKWAAVIRRRHAEMARRLEGIIAADAVR